MPEQNQINWVPDPIRFVIQSEYVQEHKSFWISSLRRYLNNRADSGAPTNSRKRGWWSCKPYAGFPSINGSSSDSKNLYGQPGIPESVILAFSATPGGTTHGIMVPAGGISRLGGPRQSEWSGPSSMWPLAAMHIQVAIVGTPTPAPVQGGHTILAPPELNHWTHLISSAATLHWVGAFRFPDWVRSATVVTH